MKEDAVLLGEPRRLAGVITYSDDSQADQRPWMLILNAGLIHKVGPHRLHVRLARRLAEAGFHAVRFDFSGVGDSPPRADNLPSDKSAPLEVVEVINSLASTRRARSFVALGICSGAVHSFQAAAIHENITGAVLINAQARDLGGAIDSYVHARHGAFYFWNVAFLNPRSWWRALTGRINYGAALRDLLNSLRVKFGGRRQFTIEGFDIAGDLKKIAARRVPLFLVYSRGDPGVDLLDAVAGREVAAMKRDGLVEIEVIPDADHIFTPVWSQDHLIQSTLAWITTRFKSVRPAESGT